MFRYGLSRASSHSLLMMGLDSCLGNEDSFLGKSEDSILGTSPPDVDGRTSRGELDIFAGPPELEGRPWERKSGLGRSKKKDLIRLLLLLVLCVETLSVSSRSRFLEIGTCGGGIEGGGGIGIGVGFDFGIEGGAIRYCAGGCTRGLSFSFGGVRDDCRGGRWTGGDRERSTLFSGNCCVGGGG
jgi:hypothetical protein